MFKYLPFWRYAGIQQQLFLKVLGHFHHRSGAIYDESHSRCTMAPELLLGAAISFAVGSFLYIMVYFFVYPVFKYRKVKNQAISDLLFYRTAISTDDPDGENPKELERKLTLFKKHALDLGECFETILPNWYKLALKNRNESPVDASKNLLALYNTSNVNHATARINMIKLNLKL